MWKFSYSFRIILLHKLNSCRGNYWWGKLFKGGNYSRKYGIHLEKSFVNLYHGNNANLWTALARRFREEKRHWILIYWQNLFCKLSCFVIIGLNLFVFQTITNHQFLTITPDNVFDEGMKLSETGHLHKIFPKNTFCNVTYMNTMKKEKW